MARIVLDDCFEGSMLAPGLVRLGASPFGKVADELDPFAER